MYLQFIGLLRMGCSEQMSMHLVSLPGVIRFLMKMFPLSGTEEIEQGKSTGSQFTFLGSVTYFSDQ